MSSILGTGIIFYIIVSGFKFYLKLRGTIDFSYLAIVIFATYVGALVNIHFWYDMAWCILIAIGCSLPFTLLVLFLSSRLSEVYFSIGSLALYILWIQLALNLDITNGALGIYGMDRTLFWISIITTKTYSAYLAGIGVTVMFVLMFIQRTYFFSVLKSWWENTTTLRSLGTRTRWYTFFMICLTTILAAIGGNLYGFYYLYIEPSTFWIGFLIVVITIGFIWYRFWELLTAITAIVIISWYEWLRFLKFIEPGKLGYIREMVFALICILAAYIVFRTTKFSRQH